MRKIDSYFKDEPTELKNAIKDKLAFPKQPDEIKSAIYGKAKPKLREIYHDKCAYCEVNIAAGAHYHVEHFRPKGNKNHKKDYPNFTGYYWLGYEWTNFLLVCPNCNTIKSDSFPLITENKRITEPKDASGNVVFDIENTKYKNEQPLLLHPVIDNDKIGEHIYFKRNGKIDYLSDKGKMSIDCYGLNRDDLRQIRAKKVLDIQLMILYLYENGKIPSEEKIIERVREIIVTKLIRKIQNDKTTFIAFRTTILRNFEEFVIKKKIYLGQGPPIEIPQQDLWIKYAKEVLKDYSNFTP